MKTEHTETGWKEITTKVFTVEKRFTSALMTIADWVDFSVKYPKIGRKRMACKCCRYPWADMDRAGKVFLLLTNKGNAAVCKSCYDRFPGAKKV